MSGFLSHLVPGMESPVFSEDPALTWTGRQGQTLVATRPVLLDSTCEDGGATPTTMLRAGNIVAINSATGRGFLYDPDADDGTQIAVGILEHSVDMLQNGVAVDRLVDVIVAGRIKQSDVIGLDACARAQFAGRIQFDQDWSNNGGFLLSPRAVYRKSANYTLTQADHGCHFIASAAVTFTLPAKHNGLTFRFTQIADANLTISSSGDLVVTNNAAASTVSCQTASEKIGSQLLVECVFTSPGTLKWIVTNLGGTTLTVS